MSNPTKRIDQLTPVGVLLDSALIEIQQATSFSATIAQVLALVPAQPLNDGLIFVGDALNAAVGVAMSGDISIDNTGVTTIASGAITNAKVNASAAIDYSKLALTDSIINADINSAAAIAQSKLALSITNAELAGGLYPAITGIGVQTQPLDMNSKAVVFASSFNLQLHAYTLSDLRMTSTAGSGTFSIYHDHSSTFDSTITMVANNTTPAQVTMVEIEGRKISLIAGSESAIFTINAMNGGVMNSVLTYVGGNDHIIMQSTTMDFSSSAMSNVVLVTPALGTPASGVMTNVTGTASGLTAGNVTTNANLTGGVTSVGNAATVITNANLTGDVTSVGNATTIAVGAVDIAMLSASGTPDATTFLRGDNTWTAVSTFSGNLSDLTINANKNWLTFDITNAGKFETANAAGPAILNEASTSSNPTLIPDRSELTTGIGGTGNDLSIIRAGSSQMNFESSGITIPAATVNFLGTATVRNVKNLGIGGFSWGTSADHTISALIGTPPTTDIANQAAMYVANQGADGTAAWHFREEGGLIWSIGENIEASNAAGPAIINTGATSTVVTLAPNKADPNTGIGWEGTDNISLIAGGVQVARANSSKAWVFPEATVFHTGTTTGFTLGNGPTHKIGFHGATPIVQQAHIADATDAATAISQLNLLLAQWAAVGFQAAS